MLGDGVLMDFLGEGMKASKPYLPIKIKTNKSICKVA